MDNRRLDLGNRFLNLNVEIVYAAFNVKRGGANLAQLKESLAAYLEGKMSVTDRGYLLIGHGKNLPFVPVQAVVSGASIGEWFRLFDCVERDEVIKAGYGPDLSFGRCQREGIAGHHELRNYTIDKASGLWIPDLDLVRGPPARGCEELW